MKKKVEELTEQIKNLVDQLAAITREPSAEVEFSKQPLLAKKRKGLRRTHRAHKGRIL